MIGRVALLVTFKKVHIEKIKLVPTTYMIHDRTRCTFGYLQKS